MELLFFIQIVSHPTYLIKSISIKLLPLASYLLLLITTAHHVILSVLKLNDIVRKHFSIAIKELQFRVFQVSSLRSSIYVLIIEHDGALRFLCFHSDHEGTAFDEQLIIKIYFLALWSLIRTSLYLLLTIFEWVIEHSICFLPCFNIGILFSS